MFLQLRIVIISTSNPYKRDSIMHASLSLSPYPSLSPSPFGIFSAPLSAAHFAPARSVDSGDLLRGEKTVTIVHNGVPYRLQATRLGKLILTK